MLDFVFMPITENFLKLSTDSNGLPVVRKIK
jgi:hypothetical protein